MAQNEDFLRLAAQAAERTPQLTPAQARERVAQGATLVDVRDADELTANPPLPSAVNISRGRLELRIADAIADKDAEVVLYCGGGNRGALAADSLRQMGYTNVSNVAGGLTAWRAQEAPKT